jgi:hypothetical protein
MITPVCRAVGSSRARWGLVDVSGLRVTWPRATVPVAPDEATARQLLDRRPRVLVRHIDLSSHALGAAGAGFVSRLVSA